MGLNLEAWNTKDCVDPTATDLKCKMSFPHNSWSLKTQAVHRDSHSQCAVYLIWCHGIHWPWRDTDLYDTTKCYSIMFIFMYDHALWWKSIIIIKNKTEPSKLHCIVLRLGGFHTLKICLRLWITSWQARVSGHYLHLLMLKTQWLTTLEAMFLTQGGERPSTGRSWS